MTTKRSGAKRPAKKATKKAARKAAVGGIPSPVEVLGEVGAGLTEKQREFAILYAADPNATRAYQRSHPEVAYNTARTEGSMLLHHSGVRELVATLRTELLAKFNVTNERIIEEYARIAFLDIADLYGPDGKLLAVHDMPEHARRAIAEVVVDELFEGTGKDRFQLGFTSRVKTVGKRDALQDLAKIRKMLTDKVEHSIDESFTALVAQAFGRP